MDCADGHPHDARFQHEPAGSDLYLKIMNFVFKMMMFVVKMMILMQMSRCLAPSSPPSQPPPPRDHPPRGAGALPPAHLLRPGPRRRPPAPRRPRLHHPATTTTTRPRSICTCRYPLFCIYMPAIDRSLSLVAATGTSQTLLASSRPSTASPTRTPGWAQRSRYRYPILHSK